VVNWRYYTEVEPEMDGRKIFQPRGKVLGGSSAINGLIYIRGQREDFDGWRQAGNVGWSFDDVLPYFRKSEHQTRGPDEFHGGDGPLWVSDQSEPHELCEAFIEASQQAGHPRNDDFNGASQEGAGYFQTTSRGGFRCSTATAYLKPARKRSNLTVVTRAHANKIAVRGATRRWSGMESDNGEPQRATAGAEVIASAGAINTPSCCSSQVSVRARCCRPMGVPVVHELAGVGENLQDHLQVRMRLPLHQADHLQRRYGGAPPDHVDRDALPLAAQGPADGQRRLRGRVLQDRPTLRQPRHSGPLHQLQPEQDGRQARPVLGLYRLDVPAAA
jgi:choline dehydrogenase